MTDATYKKYFKEAVRNGKVTIPEEDFMVFAEAYQAYMRLKNYIKSYYDEEENQVYRRMKNYIANYDEQEIEK